LLEPQTDDQQHHHYQQTFAAQQTQLEEATVSDIGGMNDFTYIRYLLVSFSLAFAHADYGNDTHHVAKRPQSEWPNASTVRVPMVQVGNKPLLVLIDNPISQSVMFFFLSLPIAVTNGSTWSFRSIKTCYHAGTFRFR